MRKIWLGLKRLIISILVVVLFLNSCNVGMIEVSASSRYNRTAALAYAEAHWNDGVGLCAEFVSNCIKSGGSTSWSASCTELRRQLMASGWGIEYELRLESDMSIKASAYVDKLEPGDVVFYYCPECVNIDGKPYIHAVLCNGMDENGYMKAYSHNNANSGQSKYRYNSKCRTCETPISKAYVYHFTNASNAPQGVLDSVTSGNGTITVRGWAFDRDDLNAQLDIHVYVGGPAGSGAPAYVIKADKERKDVNDAYPGVGNYHGFDEKIKVSVRGQTEVYVYAINNVRDQYNPLLGQKKVNITNEFSVDFESNLLSVKAGESDVMGFNFTGDGIGSMQYSIEDTDVCSAVWGTTDWTQGTTSLIISGKKTGNTNVTVMLLDSNKETLYQKSFKVSVSAVTGNISISPSNLILNTSNNMAGTIVLDFSACKNASQLFRSYTNGSIIEEAYEIDGTTVIFTYTAKDAGETQVVYTVVDKYGNELGKATAEIVVQLLVTGIHLDKEYITLNKGDNYWLTEKITPSDASDARVSWSSSNTSVATVDANGKVTAVGKGEATITAKAKDGSGVSASCEVTVKQPVTSLSLNKTSLPLNKSDSYTLTATASPSDANNKAVTWTSSNTSVVTVDANGKVTAIGKGEATITATAKDGSGVMVQCKVKVIEQVSEQTYHFADVLDGTWQYNVAKHAVMSGLMKGKSNSADGLIIFDPNNNMTRAEFVQTLYNKEGKPAVNYVATFKDVPSGQWYTNAILWAAQNNIVAGKGEIFDVTGKITRQEMATILYKYAANFKGYETAGRIGFDGYVDASSISSWATENMKWALHYGIMKGQGTKLAPQANATRAECAAMLKNFMDIYE